MSTQWLHGKIYRVVKLRIFQHDRVTNLVISQQCLHFKYMKVNILGKFIIKIPDLQNNHGIIQRP